jgi:hypothetical protein
MPTMIDIIINDQLVAVVVEELAKLFVTTLVQKLPSEMSVVTRIHKNEPQEGSTAE